MRIDRLLVVLLFLALQLWAPSASANLLYSGGEDTDFICNPAGGCLFYPGGGLYRPAWSRGAYEVPGSSTDPATYRFGTPVFTASSTLWLHAQFCTGYTGCTSPATVSGAQMLRIFDSNGNPALIVRGTGTSGQLKISSRTSGGTFTDLVTCSSAFNATLNQIDLYINYGTSGEVSLYNNSVQICDYTGNVTNGDGATTLDQAEFASPNSSQNGSWSEVIIATTDTRAMSRFTANTVANGNTTGFTGTNICSAIWNVTSYNDANFGSTGTANTIHECTIKSSIPTGTYAVQGVTMSARALVGGSGPQHLSFVTRTGGTDYTSSNYAPTNTFSNVTGYIQTINPATSSAWTLSDLQNSSFNVGEEATP